ALYNRENLACDNLTMSRQTEWLPPAPGPPAPPPPQPPFPPAPATLTADQRQAAEALGQERRSFWRRVASGAAAVGALIASFAAKFKALLLLLPKLKLLTTSGTALVSVAAYSLFWGWKFAVGFVLLLFVHEMGHVIQLRREGVKASAPVFIPFLGAVIWAKELGGNALAEARVGLAGPILGSLGALAFVPLASATHNNLFRALAYTGFLLNLFNLLPVLPLDGGRAMAAMAPWMWFLGFAALIALVFIAPNPILLLVLVFGGLETWRRWRLRRSDSPEEQAYYRVKPRDRALVAAVYLGLIALLAFGMSATYLQRTL
ncbi:MAG TPA: site-2 protease family protein, partial [Solirubrobacteraceae bacterium]|nr:site-2 protease family protein [Solirubrobacteraceae bacterium]